VILKFKKKLLNLPYLNLDFQPVTIVEEDGSTSVVDDASVSSILTDAGPNSSIQFGQTQGGNFLLNLIRILRSTYVTITDLIRD